MYKYFISVVISVLIVVRAFSQIDFAPVKVINTGSFPKVVAIGDVNNDSINDIVLGTSFSFDLVNDYKIFVFIQNHNGTLKTPNKYAYNANNNKQITSIAIADVNNDHLNDIVYGYSDSIGIFFQNTIGSFDNYTQYFSGKSVESIKCGDLNQDSLIDIAVDNGGSNYISIFYQQIGNYQRDTFPKPSGNLGEIDISDMNGDNKNDIVLLMGQLTNEILVYLQDSISRFPTYTSYSSPNIYSTGLYGIAIGDMNLDGRKDLVASKRDKNSVYFIDIWHQDKNTNFLKTTPEEININYQPEPIEVADINCDNSNEIVVVNIDIGVNVLEYDSLLSKYSNKFFPKNYATHTDRQGLSIGDINNDGRKDIVVANYNYGLELLYNTSMPKNETIITKLVTADTFLRIKDKDSITFQVEYRDTVNGYLISGYNLVTIIHHVEGDSIRIDSVVIKQGILCNNNYLDTAYYSRRYLKYITLPTDSSYIRMSADSTNLFEEIKIMPNPTNGYFSIILPTPFDIAGMRLFIFDISGKKVKEIEYNDRNNKRDVDINDLSNGDYLVHLISSSYNNQKCTIKIQKL